MVASILAVSTGWRWGTTMTEVRSCNRSVLAGEEGERGQLIEAFADGARRPLPGFAVGIAGGNVARHDDMVVDADEAEAQPLGRLGDGDVAIAIAHGSA